MKSLPTTVRLATILLSSIALYAAPAVQAQEVDSSIAACLKAWGQHPFGSNPQFKTMSTSVRVFGIGKSSADTEVTSAPALVLVNPGVNVMGGSTIELMNPNGWYCLRTNVTVMGGLNIRTHCKAHLASSADGTTVMGENSQAQGVTVMGSTHVERVDCR